MKTSIITVLVVVLSILTVQAQGLFGLRQRPVRHSSGTQWYVGATVGANHATAIATQSFSELSLVNASTTDSKDYRTLPMRTGYSAGIATTVAFTPYLQAALSTQYKNINYSYQHAYYWGDAENEENQLLYSNDHSLSLGYIEIPLRVRYAFPISRFKPFVQAGFIYGRLVEANKHLVSHSVDYAAGGSARSISHQQTDDVEASYLRSRMAYLVGGGLTYNFGGLMLIAEASYQPGLHNVTDVRARYTATRHLAGLGHVPDDITINTLSYSVGFLFPMKFLTDKDFKPVIF